MILNIARSTLDTILDALLLGPTFPLRALSQCLNREYHAATIKRGGKIIFRPKATDAKTFIDIFRHGAYDFSRIPQYERALKRYCAIVAAGKVPTIIDAGANVGAASVWFSQAFPEAQICAVEPDAANAVVLRRNAEMRPQIVVIEAAIGSEPGRVSLSNPLNQAWSVQTARDANGGVSMVTIDDVMAPNRARNALFLVKVDIEGFEADLFQKNLGWLDEVQVLIIEPHDYMLPGARTSKNFQKAMLERDFEMIISGENLIYVRL